MKISDILGMSLTNLWRRKMRTLLTVLGVIIGTASIVVMLSLGIGLKKATLAEVNNSGGLTEILVESDSDTGMEHLLLDDKTVDKFKELEYVKDVVPMIVTYMPIQAGKYEAYFEVVGTTKPLLEKINLGEGRLPGKKDETLSLVFGNQLITEFYDSKTGDYPYWDNGENIDVDLMKTPLFAGIEREDVEPGNEMIDDSEATGYFDSTFSDSQDDFGEEDGIDFGDESEEEAPDEGLSDDAMQDGDGLGGNMWGDEGEDGEPISYTMFTEDMKKVPIKVSGIEAGNENSYSEFQYAAYTDIEALKNFLKNNYNPNEVVPGQPTDRNGKPYRDLKYSQMVINVDEAKNVEEVLATVQEMGYRATANKEWIEETEKQFLIIEAVLGGIGAVAMLVAAISIANTMTMSTYERTKEIGIMKVLGCNLGNIRSMFLAEAAFIGFLGGIAGVGLSFVLSMLLNKVVAPTIMSEQFGLEADISAIPPWLVLLAIVFATIIGMLAGFFPAQRATKLSPLAAIRNE